MPAAHRLFIAVLAGFAIGGTAVGGLARVLEDGCPFRDGCRFHTSPPVTAARHRTV